MKCNYCTGICIKKGYYKDVQRYQYKGCKKYQQSEYAYRKYDLETERQVTLLNNEGMGISSISRVLRIPKTSVLRRILNAASNIIKLVIAEQGQTYEVDELHTYVRKNASSCHTYIIYAINRTTRSVIDFVIGARSKENISRLINKLMSYTPQRIYTDKLRVFGSLILERIHRTFQYQTNRIERKNLTIRTHLKSNIEALKTALQHREICRSTGGRPAG